MEPERESASRTSLEELETMPIAKVASDVNETSSELKYARFPVRELGLKDKKSWSEPDFSPLWCGKVWFKVVGGQL